MSVKPLIFAAVAALLLAEPSAGQDGTIIAGGGGVFATPLGSLHQRYTGAVGGMAYVGKRTSPTWTWIGRLEALSLTTINAERQIKSVSIEEAGVARTYAVPLTKMSMSWKGIGASAEAMAAVLQSSAFEAGIHMGFGFTYWEHKRGEYRDSLFAQSVVTGNRINVANLSVPENRQSDWSGCVNAGCDLQFKAIDPLWVTLSADYRLIIGELWQALDLDMENVSGLQFLSLRAGVHVRL